MNPEELYRLADVGKQEETWLFEAELNPEHAVFKGHFPGNPVMPGVCTLHLVRACVSKALGYPVVFSAIKSCKFLSTVIPVKGEKMQVSFSLTENKLQGKAFYRGSQVLKLTATVRAVSPRLGCVLVIPVFNNGNTIGKVIADVKRFADTIWVVNDGSTDSTAEVLAKTDGIRVITIPTNRGKGNALKTALKLAAEEGYSYVLTMDADGQHYADDIPVFLDEIQRNPDSLLIGARNLVSENMPSRNTFANRFSNFWFRVETGNRLSDTQSGFRLYPVKALQGIRMITSRYEFEVEIIVRAAWRGIKVANVPIKVYYAPEGERVSHFRPFRDFFRISVLNTFLVIWAVLWYYPWRFLRMLTKENIRKFIRNNITHSKESNVRLAAAMGWGVSCGILPVWGYQLVFALFTAHLLRLNKVLAAVFSNISVPPLIPFILYGSLMAGAWITGSASVFSLHEISFAFVRQSFLQYVIGSVVLAFLAGMAVFLIAWAVLGIFKRKPEHE